MFLTSLSFFFIATAIIQFLLIRQRKRQNRTAQTWAAIEFGAGQHRLDAPYASEKMGAQS